MSPLPISSEEKGLAAVSQKSNPFQIKTKHFFEDSLELKKLFANLIDAPDYENIAIIPSVSYAMANVTNNIKLNAGDEILILKDQFPSNYYAWKKKAEATNAVLKIVAPPGSFERRGELWNAAILDAITEKTAVVTMGHVHWADGTKFNLKAIREKTRQHNALLIIDGTQSVGALPFSVKEIQPDVLICAGYKWLLGPYGLGLAYFSDYFNNGEPIENNWKNRAYSENFQNLINYQEAYKPKAERYSMGESSNFITLPILIESLKQLLEWTPEKIQDYCKGITQDAVKQFRALGCFVEDENYRGHHMFGVYLPKHIDLELLKAKFEEENIYLSVRGNSIRIAAHVFNSKTDLEKVLNCIKSV